MKVFQVDLYQYFNRERVGNGGLLTCYVADCLTEIPSRSRPALVVFPGGGYKFVSQRENEPVALKFLQEGFNVFVLNYSVDIAFPHPLLEASMAISYVRENSGKLHVIADKVCVMGFSAGGHLAGMSATMFRYSMEHGISRCRPDAVALCYPVITADRNVSHTGSFDVISGGDEQLRSQLSLENAVDENSSPAFIWHTFEDDCVPVANSLLMAQAYARKRVPFQLHIFEKGGHGMSVDNRQTWASFDENTKPLELSQWTQLLVRWLRSRGFEISID